MNEPALSKFSSTAVPVCLFAVLSLLFIFSKSLNLNSDVQRLMAGRALTERYFALMELPSLPAFLWVPSCMRTW